MRLKGKLIVCLISVSVESGSVMGGVDARGVAGEPRVIQESLTLFDEIRARTVPVEIYRPANRSGRSLPVAIVNHGNTIQNTEYTFLAHHLVALGYYVACPQHSLPSDSALPKAGNVFLLRMPVWERCADNILFIQAALKQRLPQLKLDKLLLLGHSHGGDICLHFAKKYPGKVSRLISLDSLRYPFPQEGLVPMLTLRAKDPQYKTDPGILPASRVRTVVLFGARHTDLCDRGPEQVKRRVLRAVEDFLQAPPILRFGESACSVSHDSKS